MVSSNPRHQRLLFQSLGSLRQQKEQELQDIDDMMTKMVDEHPWLASATSPMELESDDPDTEKLLSRVRRCKTQSHAIIEVATLMGPEVHARAVAEILLRSGRWGARFETLRSRTTKILADHPDWIAQGNGRYRQACEETRTSDSTDVESVD
jgi:hypothetical protein